MKFLARLISLTVILFLLPVAPAEALTVSAGNCTATVDSTSGVYVAESGGYCYVAFATNSLTYSWQVPSYIATAQILMVAGGGAGGSAAWGGGGGAGQVLFASAYPVTANATVSLYVGAGGTSGNTNIYDQAGNRSTNGTNSWFGSSSTFYAVGGGAGASFANGNTSYINGSAGGSGGGATEYCGASSGGAASTNIPANVSNRYGFKGGDIGGCNYQSGSGGGGAGAAGGDATSSVSGAGGAGINTYSAWFTALGRFGVSGFIAGGGGGGSSGTLGAGGSGGGGKGGGSATPWRGADATANTGSGGGGASYSNGGYVGGAGGSGLIIIKYSSDTPPVITGPASATGANSSISIAENTTSVFTFTANETVTWMKSGADESFFSISSSGVLTVSVRDFELKADVGADNVYTVVITASDSNSQTTSQTLSVIITNQNESATINSISLSASPSKGVSVTITVSLNTPGKVRFFANNKRIAACLSRVTTGSYGNVTATCDWKPTTRGVVNLSATAYPTDTTFATANSNGVKYFVLNKSSTR